MVYLNVPDSLIGETYGKDVFYMLNTESELDTIFDLASAPSSYNENFSTTFTNVQWRDWDGNLLTTGSIDSSSFRATADDLSPSDSMHWGDWSASYTIGGEANEESGFWTAGKVTMEGDVDTLHTIVSSYTLNGVAYNGIYRAIRNGSEVVNGTASMNVDFGMGSASLIINQPNSSSQWASYSMYIDTVESATVSGPQDGSGGSVGAFGFFYGETGNDIGGTFDIDSSSGAIEAEGVYQVHTDTVLH